MGTGANGDSGEEGNSFLLPLFPPVESFDSTARALAFELTDNKDNGLKS
jgi:hypothetical protein